MLSVEQLVDQLIDLSFAEDIGDGDHTTLCCIPADAMGKSHLLIKEDGILAGVEVAKEVFRRFDPEMQVEVLMGDGSKVKKADLAILDTKTGKVRRIEEINSKDVDSFHTWSSTGRWMVFSSKRMDGGWARPYFAHFNTTTGRFDKPFSLRSLVRGSFHCFQIHIRIRRYSHPFRLCSIILESSTTSSFFFGTDTVDAINRSIFSAISLTFTGLSNSS